MINKWSDRQLRDLATKFRRTEGETSSRDLKELLRGHSPDESEMKGFSRDNLEEIRKKFSPDEIRIMELLLSGPKRMREIGEFEPEDIEQAMDFIEEAVLDEPEVKEHLILRKIT